MQRGDPIARCTGLRDALKQDGVALVSDDEERAIGEWLGRVAQGPR